MKHKVETKTHIIQYEPILTEILNKRGMTQDQLAQEIGLPQANISRFDRVTQHRDAYELLIAHALKLNVDDLYRVKIIKKELK